MQDNHPLMMSSKDIIKALSLTPSTFYRLIKKGVFQANPNTKRNRVFDFEQVKNFIKQTSLNK